MRFLGLILIGAGLAATAGCGGRDNRGDVIAPAPDAAEWRRIATSADRARLSGWRIAFTAGLEAARNGGKQAEVAAEGALLQPDVALDDATLPPGNYRCRVLKLGASRSGMADFIAYPAFACRAAMGPGGVALEKIAGSQRPVGMVYPDNNRRQIFLGTMMLGDETRAMGYGRDPDRDMIGAVERIGPKRWRLVLPSPHFESLIDIVELVPAA